MKGESRVCAFCQFSTLSLSSLPSILGLYLSLSARVYFYHFSITLPLLCLFILAYLSTFLQLSFYLEFLEGAADDTNELIVFLIVRRLFSCLSTSFSFISLSICTYGSLCMEDRQLS